jgi:hypothetical protein
MTNAVSIAQSGSNNVSWRNRIINGDMRINQRALGTVTVNSSGLYTVDRWQANQTATGKYSIQQSSTVPAGFTNSYLATSLSAYSVSSSDIFFFLQCVEGYNIADFGWGAAGAASVTLSFWVRSSLTGTFGGALANATQDYCYPFSYAISAANTWEQKTVTISGPTAGTWNTTNGIGVQVIFGLGGGSTRSAAAGSWTTSSIYTATGATSVVGTNGATFYITGVQLEAGTSATPFEYRDYGRELLMCQRYCEGFGLSGSGEDKDLCMGAGNGSGGSFQAFFPWKVQKRAAPTVSLAAASNFYVHVPGAFRVTCTSLSAVNPTETGTHLSGVSSSGSFSVGQACFLAAIPTTALVIASAEL